MQLLHIKLPTRELIRLRDTILSARVRNWDKKSFLAKALMFHYKNANLQGFDNISYHHLLMAELIRNFSIASKEEYLKKCEEFRIYPFQNKAISKMDLNESGYTLDDLLSILKTSFNEMNEQHDNEIYDEVDNAINQDYPICSFEELLGKIRFN
jgi:hypothetical protein